MGFLRRLDERLGALPPERADRRGRLHWLATRKVTAYVPRDVYVELVELHDRVVRLEAAVRRLELDARVRIKDQADEPDQERGGRV